MGAWFPAAVGAVPVAVAKPLGEVGFPFIGAPEGVGLRPLVQQGADEEFHLPARPWRVGRRDLVTDAQPEGKLLGVQVQENPWGLHHKAPVWGLRFQGGEADQPPGFEDPGRRTLGNPYLVRDGVVGPAAPAEFHHLLPQLFWSLPRTAVGTGTEVNKTRLALFAVTPGPLVGGSWADPRAWAASLTGRPSWIMRNPRMRLPSNVSRAFLWLFTDRARPAKAGVPPIVP